MKRVLILGLFVALAWNSHAVSVPTIGYAVGTQGYSLEDASYRGHAALDFIWRPAGGPATLRIGTAVPTGDGWFSKVRFSLGADIRVLALRNHPFGSWISLESQWAPAISARVVRGIGKDDPVLLQAALQPLRFEVGGGYLSLLSPAVYADLGGGWNHLPAGWGIALFDFGFYMR